MGRLSVDARQNLIADMMSLACIERCEWYTNDRTGDHRLLLVRATGSWFSATGEKVRETVQRHVNIPTTLRIMAKE
jgi:hypothetical protein